MNHCGVYLTALFHFKNIPEFVVKQFNTQLNYLYRTLYLSVGNKLHLNGISHKKTMVTPKCKPTLGPLAIRLLILCCTRARAHTQNNLLQLHQVVTLNSDSQLALMRARTAAPPTVI